MSSRLGPYIKETLLQNVMGLRLYSRLGYIKFFAIYYLCESVHCSEGQLVDVTKYNVTKRLS